MRFRIRRALDARGTDASKNRNVAAANIDSPTRHRITLTDFNISGVNIVPDQNDQVATVILGTVPGFTSPLSLFIDAPSLLLDVGGRIRCSQ